MEGERKIKLILNMYVIGEILLLVVFFGTSGKWIKKSVCQYTVVLVFLPPATLPPISITCNDERAERSIGVDRRKKKEAD